MDRQQPLQRRGDAQTISFSITKCFGKRDHNSFHQLSLLLSRIRTAM
jgi:hypothetical protein